MSYILEALKKAEHQREIGQVPRIDSEHETVAAGLSSRWVMIVVLVLAINAGLLLALFWPDTPADVSGRAVLSRDASSATGAKLQPQPQPQPQPRPQPQRADTADRLQGPRPTDAGQYRRENIRTRAPEAVPPVTPDTVPTSERLSPPVAQVSQRPRVAPVTAAAPVRAKITLPVWPQVPAHIFNQLSGGLKLDVHVYSDQPQDRFVLVNLQKYHVGEQLQEGPVLDEITAEGVILSFQGQQFLVRAQ